MNVIERADDRGHRATLIDMYFDTENPLNVFNNWDNVLMVFKRENLKCFFNDDFYEYKNLPDEVTVYRGILVKDGLKQPYGVSWTTDFEVAYMFANRFAQLGGEAYIIKAEIRKEDILYYYNGRKESEVILDCKDLLWSEICDNKGEMI